MVNDSTKKTNGHFSHQFTEHEKGHDIWTYDVWKLTLREYLASLWVRGGVRIVNLFSFLCHVQWIDVRSGRLFFWWNRWPLPSKFSFHNKYLSRTDQIVPKRMFFLKSLYYLFGNFHKFYIHLCVQPKQNMKNSCSFLQRQEHGWLNQLGCWI
jgi:hypothetical protein